ncbi:uncharacterized protein LOC129571113 [Sitodiplosis mosellana]|uniref:uncharacterized protein LOC129571113 n=1 Tax=Sitodiplosis mosellana TaxID=263140 RepID=UPI002444CE42|nr:uncharacterized protein LOC129571113 [Sitodiplosis mosellana]
MNSFCLFVFVACVLFASVSANEILVRQIRSCQKQFPKSESRTLPDFDLDLLTKDDKCYLNCIMTVQKVIWNGGFNVDALEFTVNNPKIADKFRKQCGPIRHTDKCEYAARLQKCIEIVIRKTPTSHFPTLD